VSPADVERQIGEELDRVAHPIWFLLAPDLLAEMESRIASHARAMAGQLAQDEDDRLAAQTVIDLMTVCYADRDPDSDWWRTPLGRLVARSIGADDAEAVSRSVAAAMLGVHPGTVAQLVHRGRLDRHPDGGITRASVLMRLARATL
jgi:hypothetical protein